MRVVKGQKVNVTGWTRGPFRGLSPENLKMLCSVMSGRAFIWTPFQRDLVPIRTRQSLNEEGGAAMKRAGLKRGGWDQ